MRLNKRFILPALITLTILLAGCSPEGDRELGGGQGGDPGNHGANIQLQGDHSTIDRIFYETPSMGRAIERKDHGGAVTSGS
ncbi:MAG: hypothetical protein WD401_00290 [Thermomicrobiaceae bacterium]